MAAHGAQGQLDSMGDFFEGPEKTLMVELKRVKMGSLRNLPDETWTKILEAAQCQILSKVSSPMPKKGRRTRGVTAYLLSESSLFVYDNRIVMKTCGGTTPLATLPQILELGGAKGKPGTANNVASVLYSHPSYFRPELQEPLYRSFSDECTFLESYFPEGQAYHLGPRGRGVDVFSANYLPKDVISDFVQAEVYITGLDDEAEMKFGPKDDARVSDFWSAQEPDLLDEFKFEPYGYSANATKRGFYTTVHASPQASCSYMSCSTNAPLTKEELGEYTQRALTLANGKYATVYLFSPTQLAVRCPAAPAGFAQKFTSTAECTDTFTCSVTLFDAVPVTQEPVQPPVRAESDLTVADVAREYLEKQPGEFDRPVMFLDTKKVEAKYNDWVQHLPDVQPCYAVKCNPDPGLLSTLASLQEMPGFDCASEAEIKQVLRLGVAPESIVYSNPCKQASGIIYARQVGVRVLVFDNLAELEKISRFYPDAELVLRVQTDDTNAQCPMSNKFGCPVDKCQSLISEARSRDLTVTGVSFHVGSGCQQKHAFKDALTRARSVMTIGQDLGFTMNLLDIGGGFPGCDDVDIRFEEMAADIRESLAQFPDDVRVIAEPGRFFAHSSATLCAQVIAVSPLTDGALRYYLNDGLYGSFNCLLYDHAKVTEGPYLLNDVSREEATGIFFGPTCDGFDALFERTMPRLEVGDWLLFPDFGAYTSAAATAFNGMRPPVVQSF